MLSVLEEETDIYEVFPPHVDTSGITIHCESPSGKKVPLKTYNEIQVLLESGKKREVKQILRENCWPTNSTIRSQLWPSLCHQHALDKSMQEGFYWDLVNQLFGTTELPEKPILLPPFVDATRKLSYHLNRKGRNVTDRVVCVLGFACPDITYSPAVYPIAALLLHFMSEEECYNSLATLVASNKDKVFVTQTKLLYEVTWKTVMHIAKKHVKSATNHLLRSCSPSSKAERIFCDWMWWILQGLPFTHLVRVMDCYLHEGIKVFYRVAMAILNLFYKYSSNQNSEWMKEIVSHGYDATLAKFCRQIPVSPRKVLRAAFGIRALSTAYIQRVFLKTEMTLKSQQNIMGSQRQLSRSRSSENLPTSQSQADISMMSHTLTIREYYPELYYSHYASEGADMAEWAKALVHWGKTELFTLWSWLPERITMYQPVLLYTTEEHGCSLTTFYLRVEQHEPTLLMIKTCSNEVFGAYCSTRWQERNVKDERGNRMAYFGTGETFLFSLYPERNKYPWVGIQENSVNHSAELFMAADSKMITIGGGEGQAIWMDENIRFGKSDHCLTFNNPPLCSGRDFEIRVLEVYGFGGV
ncbi:GTPase-activating protein skywalker isoform X2 [Nilaparvata lugens]|uniref:GTPase-activating protein skywalker isoform X2 n=1 Tax=Nilaparvata lugens TaxID=108931 RepID=UPI00193E1577|nr:GTPase-activating protein skywalker isoform X2 [Nilaparvata lugens]